MSKKPKLSLQNQGVACFMRKFLTEYDRLPAMTEIAEHFGWRSQNAASFHVKRLVALGVLEPSGRGHRRFKRHKQQPKETPCTTQP